MPYEHVPFESVARDKMLGGATWLSDAGHGIVRLGPGARSAGRARVGHAVSGGGGGRRGIRRVTNLITIAGAAASRPGQGAPSA
jgi:hypothetical protein